MSLFEPEQCDLREDCNSCLTLAHCMFVILVGGNVSCMPSNTNYGNEEIQTVLYNKHLCNPIMNDLDLDPRSQFQHNSNSLENQRQWTMPIEQQIRETILNSYQRDQEPAVEKQRFFFQFTAGGSKYVDEESLLFTYAHMHMEWIDPRLRWNPTTTKCQNCTLVKTLNFSPSEIWWPTINVKNDDGRFKSNLKDKLLRVTHQGHVMWDVDVNVTSSCRTHTREYRYQYSTLECNLTVQLDPWIIENVDKFVLADTVNGFQNWRNNGNWDLLLKDFEKKETTRINSHYYEETSVDLLVTLLIRRNYDYYVKATWLFGIMLIVTNLVQIWLYGSTHSCRLAMGTIGMIIFGMCSVSSGKLLPLMGYYWAMSCSCLFVFLVTLLTVFNCLHLHAQSFTFAHDKKSK